MPLNIATVSILTSLNNTLSNSLIHRMKFIDDRNAKTIEGRKIKFAVDEQKVVQKGINRKN